MTAMHSYILIYLRNSPVYRYLTLFFFLFFSLTPAGPWLAADQSLPELGSDSGAMMTPAQEKRLGQAFMRSVKASEKIFNEPFAKEYIKQLGHRLAKAGSADASQNFDFFILDNPQINAFAGPDGHIGIYTGLILTSQSESELAAVIAHEIAHVTQKHLMRTFHETSQLSIPSAAVLLAAVVLGATVGGDAAIAAAAGGQAALLQKQINFTRANEQEADRVGIQTLFDTDFEPHAMPVFFERMGRANRAYSSELPEFLRTHPVTTNRIADSLSRAEQFPYKQRSENLNYYLLKALLKQKTFPRAEDGEKYFRTNLEEGRYRKEQAQRYGLVLSLIEQRKYQQAQKEMSHLLKDSPTEPVYIVQQSRLYRIAGKLARSIEILEDSQLLYPANYTLSMELAEAYTLSGSYEKAVELLKTVAASHPEDDQIYKRMAEASGKQGNKVVAHSYQADYLYLNGQLEPAIQQLEIALREKTVDFYLSSRLEAKLKAFQNEFEMIKKKDKKQTSP